MNVSVVFFVVLLSYLLIMLGVGAFFFRQNDCAANYLLGGRHLNPYVAALSAQATDMSGWLLMGLPGTAYILYGGTTEAIWTAIGLFIGTYLNWRLIARRLRRFTGRLDALTLPEFFARRFNDQRGILRFLTAVFILIFFLFYTASMFSAGAKLFSATFGIEYRQALLAGAGIIVSYTFLGGFLAVCWTDVIQGTLMFVALVVTPVVAMFQLENTGGVSALQAELAAGLPMVPVQTTGAIDWLLLISCLGWGLGYLGQPHILPRFMAIRTEAELRPARIIAICWVSVTLTAAVFCGIVGALLYPGLKDPETIFIVLASNLFSPWITAIFLTALLSAIMSTADSQLLVASSAAGSDLYQGILRPGATQRSIVWISRGSVIVVSLLAAAIVYEQTPAPGTLLAQLNESIFRLVAFAWAGFGAAFGPLVFLSLYWRRTSLPGALAGILVGGLTALTWRLNSGGVFDIYELVPGFVLSALAIVVVSSIWPASESTARLFDEIVQEGAESK